MFLPAFGPFLGVVSAFVMSHKPDLRPLLDREQSKRLGRADIARQAAKDNGRRWWEIAKSARIPYWRQVVLALALIIFAQKGYYFLEGHPGHGDWSKSQRYPTGIWVNHEIVLDERH